MVELITKNRPHISASSVKTYSITVGKMLRDLGNKPPTYLVNHPDKVIEFLKEKPFNKRKTVLASILSCCPADNKKCQEVATLYRTQMMEDIQEYKDKAKEQKMSVKETDVWMSMDDIKKVWEKMKEHVEPLWTKKQLLPDEFQQLEKFVILSLYTLTPPRRLLDYTSMKLKRIGANDNYIKDGNTFVFRTYKTKQVYGEQDIAIPDDLRKILQKWIKINPSDYLLIDSFGSPLTTIKLNQRLNSIFKRNFSVNLLRHSYITSFYDSMKRMPTIQELESLAVKMGHSIGSQMLYFRRDAPSGSDDEDEDDDEPVEKTPAKAPEPVKAEPEAPVKKQRRKKMVPVRKDTSSESEVEKKVVKKVKKVVAPVPEPVKPSPVKPSPVKVEPTPTPVPVQEPVKATRKPRAKASK